MHLDPGIRGISSPRFFRATEVSSHQRQRLCHAHLQTLRSLSRVMGTPADHLKLARNEQGALLCLSHWIITRTTMMTAAVDDDCSCSCQREQRRRLIFLFCSQVPLYGILSDPLHVGRGLSSYICPGELSPSVGCPMLGTLE